MRNKLNTLILVSLFLFVATLSTSAASQEVIDIDGDEDECIETSTILEDTAASYNYSLVTPPSHGTISSFIEPNYLTYQPAPNYNGTDTFTVKIHIVYDEPGVPPDDWVGIYNVTIRPVNDYPVANPLSISTMQNSPVSITLSGSDPVEGSDLTYSVWSFPIHGALSDATHVIITEQSDQVIIYTPETDYVGDDSFSYVVNDGTENSYEAFARITVFDPAFAQAVLIGSSSYYFRIIDAYAVADVAGTVIKMRDIEFADNILLDRDKQVTLQGGYNALFNSNAAGMTSVPGPFIIERGAATVENLTVI
jgi:hypothetical protein